MAARSRIPSRPRDLEKEGSAGSKPRPLSRISKLAWSRCFCRTTSVRVAPAWRRDRRQSFLKIRNNAVETSGATTNPHVLGLESTLKTLSFDGGFLDRLRPRSSVARRKGCFVTGGQVGKGSWTRDLKIDTVEVRFSTTSKKKGPALSLAPRNHQLHCVTWRNCRSPSLGL